MATFDISLSEKIPFSRLFSVSSVSNKTTSEKRHPYATMQAQIHLRIRISYQECQSEKEANMYPNTPKLLEA
ncbi:MAG: hypothetical protein P8046_07170 [Anaerolineales bacterium]|jgi:hypothetical protein